MKSPTVVEDAFRYVESLRGDLVALTQDLIRFPTLNPPGDAYQPCCEFIADWMKPHGFSSQIVRAHGTPGDSVAHPRANVIAHRQGGRPGKTVHFNGHIDVVEVGDGWTLDPFAGVVKDGKVYGRGACDMKGGIAASMIAVAAIAAVCPDFAGALEISGTADEESGGFGGVGYLARNGWFDRDRVHHVIIPEPLGVDRVCLGHRGVWWSEVTMKGHIGHGAMPFLGLNAIRGIGEFVTLVENELMPDLYRRITRMPCMPEGARHATLNLNSIHGGQPEPGDAMPAPVVADTARIVIDRRYLVEEDPDIVKAEIIGLAERAAARFPGMSMEWRELMTFVPTLTEPDAPVVKALDHAIHRVLQKKSEHIASPGTYDQKHITRFGSVIDCVAYGPGVLDLAHQPDEWIGIDDMIASAKIMAAAALSLTGTWQAE